MLRLPTICDGCLVKLDAAVAGYRGEAAGRFQIHCPETGIFVGIVANAGEILNIATQGPMTVEQSQVLMERNAQRGKQ